MLSRPHPLLKHEVTQVGGVRSSRCLSQTAPCFRYADAGTLFESLEDEALLERIQLCKFGEKVGLR